MKVPQWMVVCSLLFATAAQAEPTCTDWMLQFDGSQIRTCVSDQGQQFCQMIPRGSTIIIRPVPCR